MESKGLSYSSGRRPVDIFIPNWAHWPPAAVHVTLTCPRQSTVITKASEKVGYACKLAEERKFAASAELCQQNGFEFIHPAIETSSSFNSSATSFLTVWAERCAGNNLQDCAAENFNFSNASRGPCTDRTQTLVLSRLPIKELEPVSVRFCNFVKRSHFLQTLSAYTTIGRSTSEDTSMLR